VASRVCADVTAWCEFERPLADDEMKVVVGRSRSLRAISKTLARYDGGYVGLTRVPHAQRADYAGAMQAASERRGRAAVVEDVLQALVDAGSPVATASLDGCAWCEVDTPDDLECAQALMATGALA
jgi:choline kinase